MLEVRETTGREVKIDGSTCRVGSIRTGTIRNTQNYIACRLYYIDNRVAFAQLIYPIPRYGSFT